MPESDSLDYVNLSPAGMRRVARRLEQDARSMMLLNPAAAMELRGRAKELLDLALEEENQEMRLLQRRPPSTIPADRWRWR